MKWIIPKHEGVPLVEWLYAQRNIVDTQKYFRPTFKDLSNPLKMNDMDNAVDFIMGSISQNKKIFIHGDFDADGITATSIMWLFFHKYLKADVLPYIPSRFYEGYGLTEESISAIKQNGGQIIITVDCGVKDIELVNKYSNELDFVITDHHTIRTPSEDEIVGSKIVNEYLVSSKAKALVHPALSAEGFKEICGAMVAFKFCCAINQKMNLNIDMTQFTDLCAIGTICDVMPLIDENRIIVQLGLTQINKSANVGLAALREKTGLLDKTISAHHLGFVVGPRLNAAGRLGDALDAVRLLTTSSESFARQMASKLDDLNNERKLLTDKYLTLAETEIGKRLDEKVFVHFGEDWPEGLLGLIAGKLSEKYQRPAIIGSKGKTLKASARSPESFNIIEFIQKSEHFLEKYGGHSQAAGLTVKKGNLEAFLSDINRHSQEIQDSNLEKLLYLDASAQNLGDINTENAEKLMLLEPFGTKNHKPIIYIPALKIKKHSFMGQKQEHLKLFLTDMEGRVIEAISFGDASKYRPLLDYSTHTFELAATLEIDEWNGFRKPSLRIIDLRESN